MPQYDSLSLAKIFAQAEKYPGVLAVLPEKRDWHMLSRQWVCNCIFTLVGQPFFDFVEDKTEARNQKLALEKNLSIQMDPHIFAASNKAPT